MGWRELTALVCVCAVASALVAPDDKNAAKIVRVSSRTGRSSNAGDTNAVR